MAKKGKNKPPAPAHLLTLRVERCLGCHSCEINCAVAHSAAGDLAGAVGEDPPPRPRVAVLKHGQWAVPLQCRQCEDAPCVAICPTGALYRLAAGKPVLNDAEKCIGCGYCLIACPFGAIRATADGKRMVKCDLCVNREAGPACVEGCPSAALELQTAADAAKAKQKKAAAELTRDLNK